MITFLWRRGRPPAAPLSWQACHHRPAAWRDGPSQAGRSAIFPLSDI